MPETKARESKDNCIDSPGYTEGILRRNKVHK